MNRRTLLRAGAAVATGALAGCGGLLETRAVRMPPLVEDRPDAVYYPSHAEGMAPVGMATAGDYRVALSYTYPHRFWNVTGSQVSKTPVEDDDAVHLMAVVWDGATGTVIPEAGVSLELSRDGDPVSEEVIYPMLSQPMGFHYGANFPLPGEGRYDVRVHVGALPVRRTGTFRDRFDEPGTATVPFEYSRAERDDIGFRMVDRAGERGAVEPAEMEMPLGRAPAPEALPGVRGVAEAGDARFVVVVLDSPPAGVEGDGAYLAVSARTRYNRTLLPAMGLAATLTRGGERVVDATLERTVDPDLGYHYGLAVGSVEPGDALALAVETPPQVARHEGYETAFLDLPEATVELD